MLIAKIESGDFIVLSNNEDNTVRVKLDNGEVSVVLNLEQIEKNRLMWDGWTGVAYTDKYKLITDKNFPIKRFKSISVQLKNIMKGK